jgi:hypothetical protein
VALGGVASDGGKGGWRMKLRIAFRNVATGIFCLFGFMGCRSAVDPTRTGSLSTRPGATSDVRYLRFDIPAIAVPGLSVYMPATTFDLKSQYDSEWRTLNIVSKSWRYSASGPSVSIPKGMRLVLSCTSERAIHHETGQPEHTYWAVFRENVKVEVQSATGEHPLVLYQAAQYDRSILEERLEINDDLGGLEPSYYQYSISGIVLDRYFLNNDELFVDDLRAGP